MGGPPLKPLPSDSGASNYGEPYHSSTTGHIAIFNYDQQIVNI